MPTALDTVIATGMAKDPDQRYATTIALADAARAAITVPTHPPVWPDQPTGGPVDGQHTLLAPTGAAPVLPPPGAPPPPQVVPTPQRPRWRRLNVVIPALLVIAVLIGAGVFAAVNVSQHRNNKPTPAAAPTTPPPNTGPFTGTYNANFDPETRLDGKPFEDSAPKTETWGLRSVCRPGGCVAAASRRNGHTTLSTLVFDEVGGRWLAVGPAPESAATLSPKSGRCSRCSPVPMAPCPATTPRRRATAAAASGP